MPRYGRLCQVENKPATPLDGEGEDEDYSYKEGKPAIYAEMYMCIDANVPAYARHTKALILSFLNLQTSWPLMPASLRPKYKSSNAE